MQFSTRLFLGTVAITALGVYLVVNPSNLRLLGILLTLIGLAGFIPVIESLDSEAEPRIYSLPYMFVGGIVRWILWAAITMLLALPGILFGIFMDEIGGSK